METPSTSTASTVSLEVPGEPGVYWCARHKKVKTRLRCGRCERPICVKCTVMGPTGARCPECASNRTSHIYQVTPVQYATAFLAALVLGGIGAVLARAVGGMSLWLLLYAPVIGPFLGKIVTTLTRGKRGPKLATVVSAGMICGAVLSAASVGLIALAALSRVPAAKAPPVGSMVGVLLLTSLADPFLWLYLVLAIAGVWWWLK
ncbi:MAG: hypothetical protein JO316_02030 [Abitibacteriaceae bacterium]|nr:hypothetical protein [Abditibacteriaceae bacterium]